MTKTDDVPWTEPDDEDAAEAYVTARLRIIVASRGPKARWNDADMESAFHAGARAALAKALGR